VTQVEARELPAFALVLAKSDGTLGPQMRPSVDCDALRAAQAKGEAPPSAPPKPGAVPPCFTGMMYGPLSASRAAV
jgi:hypothetical protein